MKVVFDEQDIKKAIFNETADKGLGISPSGSYEDIELKIENTQVSATVEVK